MKRFVSSFFQNAKLSLVYDSNYMHSTLQLKATTTKLFMTSTTSKLVSNTEKQNAYFFV